MLVFKLVTAFVFLLSLNNTQAGLFGRRDGPQGPVRSVRLETARVSPTIEGKELSRVKVGTIFYNSEGRPTERDFGWHRDPATVVTAQGERVQGYGTVKLYVKGNLFAVLAVKRNQDFLVGSCVGPDRDLYPYLGRKLRKPTAKP